MVSDLQPKAAWKTLPLFMFVCILVMGFGGLFQPGEWYESINKAPWTPPNLVFPIAWSILYVLIAVVGWKLFAHGSSVVKWLWSLQLLLNAAWSWLFFGQHWLVAGLIDLLLLVVIVGILIVKLFKEKLNSAGLMLLPYLVWLMLATSLNTYILIYN